MITVTLDKEQYDNLLEYKKAFDNNLVCLHSYTWMYGGSIKRISTLNLDEASKAILIENERLKEEIEKLNRKKWYNFF